MVYADYPTATGLRVEFDLEAAGREATAHLIEHGHRRIGLISPPVVLDNVRPRVDASVAPWAKRGCRAGTTSLRKWVTGPSTRAPVA